MSNVTSFYIHSDSSEDTPQTETQCFGTPFQKRTTNGDILPPWSTRLGLLVFGVMQNSLAGGLIFGWASIDHTLLLAPLQEGGAGLTPKQETLMFSLGTSLTMIAALILGTVLDYRGPRMASIAACGLVALGCLIFALSSQFITYLLGIALFAFGGPGVGNSIVHIANLFPGNENFAMSALIGSIAFSFSVFAAFDYFWQTFATITFRQLFGGLSLVCFVLTIGAFLLYPDEPYEKMIEDDFDDDLDDDDIGDTEETRLLKQPPAINRIPIPPGTRAVGNSESYHPVFSPPRATMVIEQPLDSKLRDSRKMAIRTDSFIASSKALRRGRSFLSLKDQPFFSQVVSGSHLRALVVFLVSSFVTNFYVGTLSTSVRHVLDISVACPCRLLTQPLMTSIRSQLGDKQEFTAEQRHDLANLFTMIMSMGIVGSLVVGVMIDRIGLELCTAITLVLGQLQMLLILLGGRSIVAMIASFVAYALFRSCVYSVFIGSLTSKLGFKYFGMLLGIGYATSGIAQLMFPTMVQIIEGNCHLMDSTTESCDHGGWRKFEMAQLAILSALHILPILEHRHQVSQQDQIRAILASPSPFPSFISTSGEENG